MPIHRAANRFGDDEAHGRYRVTGNGGTTCMHDDIRLRGSHSVLDGVAEVRRPSHPVLSREHWSATRGSGSQFATALATPARDNGAACTGPHPQPETMDPGPTPVVRLKGALALGHDSLSSSLLAATVAGRLYVPGDRAAVAKALSNRRGPDSRSLPCRRRSGDCSRVLRSLAQVKPHCSGLPPKLSPGGPSPVGTGPETC